jgi:hypothetical protein
MFSERTLRWLHQLLRVRGRACVHRCVLFLSAKKERNTDEYAEVSSNPFIVVAWRPELFSFSQQKKERNDRQKLSERNTFFRLKNWLL